MTHQRRVWRSSLPRGEFLASAILLPALILGGCGGDREPSATSELDPVTADAGQGSQSAVPGSTPRQPADGLEAVIDVERQSVQGRFRHLRFEARLTGEGHAEASFERSIGMTLVSTVSGPRLGALEWRGTTLDGSGPLTVEEMDAAEHFASRIKADHLALIPLDLSCQAGADQLDPAIGAALLLPWQVLLKYQPQGEIPTPPQAAAESQCQHLLRPLDAIDPNKAPSPAVVALTIEHPVPMATGYFPLDLDGIADAKASEDNSDG